MTDIRRLKELELVLTKERRERLEGDALETWQPTPKQAPFIDSVLQFKKRENWFIGANRSGKSDVGAATGAKLARYGDPRARYQNLGDGLEVRDRATSGWVVALDANVSRDTIQPKYFDNGHVPPGTTHRPFIPEREVARWDKQNDIIVLRNGSIVGFKNCASERLKFQGAEKDWIHFDEEPPKDIYEEATIRVGQRALRIFGTCTLLPPQGVVGGVSWIYHDKIIPWQRGENDTIAIFGASIYDNPYILRDEIRFLETIYPEGSLGRRIRLNGEYLPGLAGARAYSNFNRLVHVRELPPLRPMYPLLWCWDFNVEPMTSIVVQRHEEIYRVYRTLATTDEDMFWLCRRFKQLYANHPGRVIIYGDATGKSQNQQSKKSNYSVIMNEMRTHGSAVELRVPESNPSQYDRINAMNRILFDENGIARLEVNSDPEAENGELITDFEAVLLADDGRIKKTTNRRDPYFWRTHYTDALGYMISYEEPVVDQREPDLYANSQPVHVRNPAYNRHGRR